MERKRHPSSTALRALLGLAVACVLGAPAAMQVSALENLEPEFFTQESWPAARWIEPPAFVVAGVATLNDTGTSVDTVVPLHVDAADRSGLLLMLLQRLAWEVEATREPSMFDLEVDIVGWLTRQAAPLRHEAPAGLPAIPAMPDAAPAVAAGVPTLAAAPTFRKINGSKPTRQRTQGRRVKTGAQAFPSERPPQLSADWNDLLPVRPMPLLPWIGVGLALFAVGWVSWRAAAPAKDTNPPSPPAPPTAAAAPAPAAPS